MSSAAAAMWWLSVSRGWHSASRRCLRSDSSRLLTLHWNCSRLRRCANSSSLRYLCRALQPSTANQHRLFGVYWHCNGRRDSNDRFLLCYDRYQHSMTAMADAPCQQRQGSAGSKGSAVIDLMAAEDAANVRVRELLRDQQLAPARRLLQDQLRLARSDGAAWAQLANLERRCAKRRRKGALCDSASHSASAALLTLLCATRWDHT